MRIPMLGYPIRRRTALEWRDQLRQPLSARESVFECSKRSPCTSEDRPAQHWGPQPDERKDGSHYSRIPQGGLQDGQYQGPHHLLEAVPCARAASTRPAFRSKIGAAYLFGYAVKTKSSFFAIVWHAAPHLPSFPRG